jgi:hypothetical protein
MVSLTVQIPASAPPDQARMIDLMKRIRAPVVRNPDVSLVDITGWPQKGQSISVVTAASGGMKQIVGTVVELEPRTAVSLGRLVVEDEATGALIELPAPITLKA